jgi:hypothetical protein
MKNHELISEEEWYRRLIADKEYMVVSIIYEKGITRVFEKETQKMYDVVLCDVGNTKMLKVVEVE